LYFFIITTSEENIHSHVHINFFKPVGNI
jgi:hypothetical protein